MSTAVSLLVFAAALVGMEGVAWATHRWLMHGPLWVLHRSHHEPQASWLELNDLFVLGFAAIAIGLFAWGARPGQALAGWGAAGVTTYGVLYALFHDGLVHRRWPMPAVRPDGYLARLRRAHRLHHAVRARSGAVCFGFLWPTDLGRALRRLRVARARAAAHRPR